MHIQGTRWFDRTYGNTYHRARVYDAGQMILDTGIHYGYGDQFIETALMGLEESGKIARRERHANGSCDGGTYFLRETLGASYDVADVSRKRDL